MTANFQLPTLWGIALLFILQSPICNQLQSQETKFFKRYTVSNGLHNREVKNIIRDQEGKFWIFSDEGVQLFTGSIFKEIPELEDLPLHVINEIQLLNNGQICLTASNFYISINTTNYEYVKHNLEPGVSISIINGQLVELNENENQIELNEKTFTITGDLIKSILWENKLVYLDINNVLRVSDGDNIRHTIYDVGILVGIIRNQILYIKGKSLFTLDINFETKILYPNTTKALIKTDSLGQELLGIGSHSRRLSSFHLYKADTILDYSFLSKEYNTIRDIYGENFNNEILLATYEGLIYQSFNRNIENILYDPELKEESLGNVIWWVIHREKDGNIYFGKESGEIFQYSGSTVSTVYPNKQYPQLIGYNYFATYDKQHDLIVTSSFGNQNHIRIWDFDDHQTILPTDFRTYSFQKFNDHQYILAGTKNKKAYISLLDLRAKQLVNDLYLPELGNKISNFEITNNTVTISTNLGLFKLQLSEISKFAGIKNFTSLYKTEFLDHKSFEEYILAGSYGNGLYIFKNDSLLTQLTSDEGLAGDVPHTINYYDGYFWIATLKGISILDKNFNIVKNVRRREGLSSLDLNLQSSASNDEYIFMGSINGLNKINKKGILDKRNLTLVPEEVSYQTENGEVRNIISNQTAKLPYDIDSCFINYETYDMFSSYFNNDYAFKSKVYHDNTLIPVDGKKIPLALRSTSNTILINSSEYSISKLLINKMTFIEKYGFNLLLILLLLLLLFYLYKLKTRQLVENKEIEIGRLKNKLEAMRSSALRSQMNPHFIFNALGSIQYHIQKEETEIAEDYLSEFAFLMRRILESSKEDFVNISEEIEMLKAYVKLEHMRFNHKFDYDFELDSSLDLSTEIPSMIIQPFIENAINHGIYHLINRKGELHINFKTEGSDKLVCIIDDNGIGREASKIQANHKHRSRSMQIVDERMNILSNTKEQSYSVSIHDKTLNQKPSGTTVSLSFGTK